MGWKCLSLCMWISFRCTVSVYARLGFADEPPPPLPRRCGVVITGASVRITVPDPGMVVAVELVLELDDRAAVATALTVPGLEVVLLVVLPTPERTTEAQPPR